MGQLADQGVLKEGDTPVYKVTQEAIDNSNDDSNTNSEGKTDDNIMQDGRSRDEQNPEQK